jgi:hypothetical protein
MQIDRKQVSHGIVSQYGTHDGTAAEYTGGHVVFSVVPGQVYTLEFSAVTGAWTDVVFGLSHSDSLTPAADAVAFKDTDGTTDLSVEEARSFVLIMPSDQLNLTLNTTGQPVFIRVTPIGY